MTYAESRGAAIYSPGSYTIVPPPRTPVGPSLEHQSQQQRKAKTKLKNEMNSLDYWNKTEDQKSGVTYYNRQQTQQHHGHRSAPKTRNPGYGPIRYPPFPSDVMSPTPPPPPSQPHPPHGIYMNVPVMPRAKLNQISTNQSPKIGERRGGEHVVWGGKKDGWDDEMIVGTSAVTPLNIYSHNNNNNNNSNHNNNNNNNAPEKKRSKRKPRWARCMQTLFCCVTPPREIEKIQSSARTTNSSNNNLNGAAPGATTIPTTAQINGNSGVATTSPTQLITQVHRDGSISGLPTKIVQNGSGDASQQNGFVDRPFTDLSSIGEKALLPPLLPSDSKKKCLVIDLDETLVHSSFKPVKNPDFVIPVEIDGVEHQVYVLKRPYADEFLMRVGELYECVLFTASLAKYADPVADLLDKKGVFRSRLFREACVFHKGNYVKDLSRLGRSLERTLIIDNSPASYAFHPENAVAVTTWFDDPADTELLDIIPTLEHINSYTNVYDSLHPEEGPPSDPLLLNHSG